MDFTPELALALYNSEEEFPVNFDDAWQWIGYANKQAAKKKLTRNFEKRIDYVVKSVVVPHEGLKTASRTEKIFITVECFEKLKTSKQNKRFNEEKRLQKILHEKMGGQTEVLTVAGRIDLLTPTSIVEIKEVRHWKAALGQILVYHNYYPSHKMILALFGAFHSSFKENVEYHCSKFNIEVIWYNR